MKQGEELEVSDGASRIYRCRIKSFSEDGVLLEIMWSQEADTELPCRLVLFQGLPKSDKMELVIQKAVELGAAEIVPVETRRCVVRLDPKKAAKKTERWQQIADGAAKQSKRLILPRVHAPMPFSRALDYAGSMDLILIPYEMAEGMQHTARILESISPGQSVAIFIGPEGGFEAEEVEAAESRGAHAISLGRRILRTETAGMTVLSIIMYLLESRNRP